MEYEVNPRDLKDSRINEVFVESDSRLLLHLRDGRAVAITATSAEDRILTGNERLTYELVNP